MAALLNAIKALSATIMSKQICALLLVLANASPAVAQVDLRFPHQAKHSVPMPGSIILGGSELYAPQGGGPFPAIVISHACGGLRQNSFDWAAKAVDAGYVALVLDHFLPRNISRNCWPDYKVNTSGIAQDAIAGMKHLRSLSIVDGKRIVHMGFSMGATAGLRTTSPWFRKRHLGGDGFAAVISFYPWCAPGPSEEINFYDDTNTPLLVLLGAKDDESPTGPCIAQAKRIAGRGGPVSWKLYPEATHAFDNSSLGDRPFTRQAGGRTFTYKFNAKSVEEAWRDTQEFLARYTGAKKP